MTQNRIKKRQPTVERATDVHCPIMVLKAKETIAAIPTPLLRVLVSKISAGIIQDKGPAVLPKQNWEGVSGTNFGRDGLRVEEVVWWEEYVQYRSMK